MTYALGRNVNHDPRSRAYRVSGPAERKTVRWERLTPVLDQGRLGSCTGNAGTGVLGTRPHWDVKPVPASTYDEAYAVQLYSDATRLDSAPGSYPPDDTGSDGLSVAKVLKARGLVSGYQHAFGVEDAFAAIALGPLMVGTTWTEQMFHPQQDGLVLPLGREAGGHEYECVGYDAATDRWEFVNSWGRAWGAGGHFFMTTAAFDTLLRLQGDVVLLVPASQPAPAPSPSLDPRPAAAAVLDAWAAKRHSGEAARAAAAWKVYRGQAT